jgi:hypothetical protein
MPETRNALTTPYIQPAEADDPQPNPPDDPAGIKTGGDQIHTRRGSAGGSQSTRAVAARQPGQDRGGAGAAQRARRGRDQQAQGTQDRVRRVSFEHVSTTRAAAGALGNVAAYLADPSSGDQAGARLPGLAARLARRRRHKRPSTPTSPSCSASARRSKTSWRRAPTRIGWLTSAETGLSKRDREPRVAPMPTVRLTELEAFRAIVPPLAGHHAAADRPDDPDAGPGPVHRARRPGPGAQAGPGAAPGGQRPRRLALPELTAELGVVAKNERRFLGFSADDSGFDPVRHRGKVVVSTMHKAKGPGVGPRAPDVGQQLRFPVRAWPTTATSRRSGSCAAG